MHFETYSKNIITKDLNGAYIYEALKKSYEDCMYEIFVIFRETDTVSEECLNESLFQAVMYIYIYMYKFRDMLLFNQ